MVQPLDFKQEPLHLHFIAKNLHYYYVLLPTGETFSTTEQEAGTGDQSMIKLLLLLRTQPHFSSVIACLLSYYR
jgi:hypothetical protein